MNVRTPAHAETLPDSTHCPLCGQPNQCAMERSKQTGEPQAECWCTSMAFCSELLSKIPAAARDRVCVCQACASPRSNA